MGSIHPSAWKGCSAKLGSTEFSEVVHLETLVELVVDLSALPYEEDEHPDKHAEYHRHREVEADPLDHPAQPHHHHDGDGGKQARDQRESRSYRVVRRE